MTFFNKKVDVSEGGKYDATKVSDSGLSQEELAALKKKQLKALDIFNKDGKAGLSKDELTEALSMYSKYAGEEGVLTKKELKEMAKEMGDDVSWKDLRRALKSMVGLMQNKNDLVAVNNAENPTVATPENTGAAENYTPKLNFDELSMDFNSELDNFMLGSLASESSNAPAIDLSEATVTANVDNNRQSRIKSRISTDPNNGEQTRFDYTYDEKGRKSHAAISDGTSIEYTYVGDTNNFDKQVFKDADGNIVSTTKYNYDENGNFVSREVSFSDGSEPLIYSSMPDNDSKLLSEVSVARNQTFITEETGPVLSADVTTVESGHSENHKYTYDSQGRKSLVNVSDGSSLAYSYVGDTNNIAELRHTDADGNLIETREYSYNTAGQKVKDVVKDGNGVITNTYDYYYAEDGSVSKVQKNAGGDIVQVEKTEMLPDGSKQVTVLSNSANYLFAAVETYDKDGKMQNVRDLPVNTGNMNELIASLKINVPDNQG